MYTPMLLANLRCRELVTVQSSSNEERRTHLHEFIDNIILGSSLPTLWSWDVKEAFLGNDVWLWSATYRKPSPEYINAEQCVLLHYIIDKFINNSDGKWTPSELDRVYKLTNIIINLIKPRLQAHYRKQERMKEEEEEVLPKNKKLSKSKSKTPSKKRKLSKSTDSPPSKKKKKSTSNKKNRKKNVEEDENDDNNDDNNDESSDKDDMDDNPSPHPTLQSIPRLQSTVQDTPCEIPQVSLFDIPTLEALMEQNLERISAHYLLSVLQRFFKLQSESQYVPKEKELQSLSFMLHHIQTYTDNQAGKPCDPHLTEIKSNLESYLSTYNSTTPKVACPFCSENVDLNTCLCPHLHRLHLCSRTFLPITSCGNLKCPQCSHYAIADIGNEGFSWIKDANHPEYCPVCGLVLVKRVKYDFK